LTGSIIAQRYAKALFQIAREEDTVEHVYDELRAFSSLLEGSADLMEFLAHPVFKRSDKKKVMEDILQTADMSLTVSHFLKLLVDKRRITILPRITWCYRQYMDDMLNSVRVHVKTAFPLSDDMVQALKERLGQHTEKNVEMLIDEDPLLIGGIIVRIGDVLYDGSIRTQLEGLSKLIREEM
jgi:F-type H+-transporting ATPase subunit delta